MKLRCPCCYGEFEIEAAMNLDAARSAIVIALKLPASIAAPLASYIGLFRPKKRSLAFDRMERLYQELLPMLAEEYVVRDGVRRACSLKQWGEALQGVLHARQEGTLTTPLESHGYLLTIAARIAEREGAKAEREGARKTAAQTGADKIAFYERMSRIAGDLELGLITADKAEEQRRIVRQEYAQ